MCVVSMVMGSKTDDWLRRYYQPVPMFPPPPVIPLIMPPVVPLPTQQELDEFRRLLDRAREYDKTHNQPDCELEEKRQKLKDMAKELGVAIDFV